MKQLAKDKTQKEITIWLIQELHGVGQCLVDLTEQLKKMEVKR